MSGYSGLEETEMSDRSSVLSEIPSYRKKSCWRTFLPSSNLGKCMLFMAGMLAVSGVVVISVKSGEASNNTPKSEPWENVRLPPSVIPNSYEIEVYPNIEEEVFYGFVNISLQVTEPTTHILFHCVGMNVSDVFIEEEGSQPRYPSSMFTYAPNDFVVLKFDASVQGPLVLHMGFNGTLTNSLTGLYKSTYTTAAGETRAIATTKFEPVYARRAFPCLDEPAMKANFTLKVTAANGRIALSNMEVDSVVPRGDGSGLTDYYFPPSVRMSTYLVCFIVCDFDKVEAATQSAVFPSKKIRVWAPADKIKLGQAQLALEASVKVLEHYEQYFGVEYPLPKQDMVAIPDFVSGAMENWGIITYRETALLYDPVDSSASNKQRVVTVVAHELAHQWFGNLVTMQWWDGLWLNEGFASFVEYLGADVFAPEFKMWDQFVVDDQDRALELDASSSSHPVLQHVDNPDQIRSLFDSISYSKGAALISMLIAMVGEDVFQAGVTRYLNAHAYSNAQTAQLWEAIGAAAKDKQLDVDVPAVMDGWTLKMGFPVLTVSAHPTLQGKAVVKQTKFTVDADQQGDHNDPDTSSYKWDLLLTGSTQSGGKTWRQWFLASSKQEEQELVLDYDPATDGYLHLNANSSGFYRVNYTLDNWERLAIANMSGLNARERASTISDAFALAGVDAIPDTVPLSLTTSMPTSTDYTVWHAVWSGLGRYYAAFKTSSHMDLLRGYAHKLLAKQYSRLGWEVGSQDTHTDLLLRALVLNQACRYELGNSTAEASSRLRALLANATTGHVPPDIRAAVYDYGVAEGGITEWEWMLGRYQTAPSASEAVLALHAMSCTKDLSLLSRTLQACLDGSTIRSQDAASLIIYVARNSYGQSLAWDFLRAHWAQLFAKFGLSSSFPSLIRNVCSEFDSTVKYDEVSRFFAGRDLGSAARELNRTLASIQSNVAWKANNMPVVLQWLAANQ